MTHNPDFKVTIRHSLFSCLIIIIIIIIIIIGNQHSEASIAAKATSSGKLS